MIISSKETNQPNYLFMIMCTTGGGKGGELCKSAALLFFSRGCDLGGRFYKYSLGLD
jgi:hypothetical protein